MKLRFWRRERPVETSPGDMRTTPVNNPLDWREDGSIRRGDPAWDFFQEIMDTGEVGIANQRPDGAWETKIVGDGDDDKRGRS